MDESVRWVLDQYPNRGIRELEDGVQVVLPVTAARWLERLLLRLGQAARIVSAPDGLGDDLRQAAAQRILTRYRRE